MPGENSLAVANEILLRGPVDPLDRLHRADLLASLGIQDGTFRKGSGKIGAHQEKPGLRFFDASEAGRIAFGPGAGLAIGASIGTESLRVCLVDANGWRYHSRERYDVDRLRASPHELVDQIREETRAVLELALADDHLKVNGKLPVLGIGVAWPTPVDRQWKPMGHALAHGDWRKGQSLRSLVRSRVGPREDGPFESYALNDAHAAALAIAHRQTRGVVIEDWPAPRLALIVRIAGGIGSGLIIVEMPRPRRRRNKSDPLGDHLESGFVNSILIAGADNHAGEIGHGPASPEVVARLNGGTPRRRIRALTAVTCSCGAENGNTHLEAYACARAVASRLGYKSVQEAREQVLADQDRADHRQALLDVGTLLAEALVSPVAVLNPATITLTGSLATEAVASQVASRITSSHPFGEDVRVARLEGSDNDYIRAVGAALAIIRNRVHRRLDDLVGHKGRTRELEGLATMVDRPF